MIITICKLFWSWTLAGRSIRPRNALICSGMIPGTLSEIVANHLEFEDGTSRGGNRGFNCTHCEKSFKGSLTRQLANLLGTRGKGIAICQVITPEDRADLQDACDGLQTPPVGGSSSGSQLTGHAVMYCLPTNSSNLHRLCAVVAHDTVSLLLQAPTWRSHQGRSSSSRRFLPSWQMLQRQSWTTLLQPSSMALAYLCTSAGVKRAWDPHFFVCTFLVISCRSCVVE